MPSSITKLDENLIEIKIDIELDMLESALNKAYLSNKNKINLPGFRKGRAPRKLIEAQFGKEVFFDDALELLFPDAMEAAALENSLNIVSRPEAYIEKKDEKAFIIAKAYTRPEAKISEYIGLEYAKQEIELLDDEIEKAIKEEQEKNARIISIEDREARDNDIVFIDFEGFIDDVAFEGGKGENFELLLGSKSFIDNFEEQIIGHNINEEFDVFVSFPDEYHASHLAGKPAVFKVRLNEIQHKELPDLNDNFAQEISEFDTFDEFKADLIQKLKERKEEGQKRDIDEQILKELRDKVEVSIPQPMIQTEANRLMQEFSENLRMQGVNISQYLEMTGMNAEYIQTLHIAQAEANIKGRLALEAIAKAEAIEATEEEYKAELESLSKLYKMDIESIEKNIGNDRKNIEEDIKAKKAFEFIKNNAKEKIENNAGEIVE